MEKKRSSGYSVARDITETRESSNIFSDPRRRSLGPESSESFVFLVLDCYSYIAGEKVTGEILFNISEPIPKASLRFQSRGVEEAQIFDSQDRTKMIAQEVHEIYTLDSTINDWETEIPVGQHVFPFNFKLPIFCPSTFYYSGEDAQGNYLKAEVFYHVSVKLCIAGTDSSLLHSRIIIIKNCRALEKPGTTVEASANVPGCCFSNRGSTHFKLCIGNTDHCSVDGEVKYKLYPNNSNCTSPINHVVGAVVMEFTVTTRKGEFKIIRKLSETARATWISAFTSLIYEKDFEYLGDLRVNSEELNPSSNSSAVIRCEYFVEMLVFYDIRCASAPIVIRLPFHVNPKINFRKEEPKLPSDWEPLETSIYSFVVENRNTMGYAPERMSIPAHIN